MLISCPKCKAVYSISDSNIPSEGKKFKCAECEKIWTVYPADVQTDIEKESSVAQNETSVVQSAETTEQQQTTVDNNDYMDEMFQRLSADTKGLFDAGNNNSQIKLKQIKRKFDLLFSPILINLLLILLLFLVGLSLMYFNRYDVVRLVPRMENFYQTLGMEALYQGRDLHFKNVQISHLEEAGKHYIEVKGQIINTGKYKIHVLPIRASLKDENDNITDEIVKILPMKNLKPKFMTLFKLTLKNKVPTPQTFHLSFDANYEKQLELERLQKEKAEKERQKKNKKLNFNFGSDNYINNF